MASVQRYINRINAHILENRNLNGVVDIVFEALQQWLGGVKQVLFLTDGKKPDAGRDFMFVKKTGEPAREHLDYNLITKRNFTKLLDCLNKGELIGVDNNCSPDILSLFNTDSLPEGWLAAYKDSTLNGYHYLLLILMESKTVVENSQWQKVQKLSQAYGNALDYHITSAESKSSHVQLKRSFSNILELLVSLLELKDPCTCGHSSNVKKISLQIGRQMNLDPVLLEDLGPAAILHDIGKIGVAENILNKPSGLNKQEFEQIKEHPAKGALLVANIPRFKQVGIYILYHHERWDGGGYPLGLASESIPLPSRIIAVADTYDAITSTRPYRDKMSPEKALSIIAAESGRQFDPGVVEAFLEIKSAKEYLTRLKD